MEIEFKHYGSIFDWGIEHRGFKMVPQRVTRGYDFRKSFSETFKVLHGAYPFGNDATLLIDCVVTLPMSSNWSVAKQKSMLGKPCGYFPSINDLTEALIGAMEGTVFHSCRREVSGLSVKKIWGDCTKVQVKIENVV